MEYVKKKIGDVFSSFKLFSSIQREHIEDLQGEHTFSLVMVAEERGETDKAAITDSCSTMGNTCGEGTRAQQAAKSWSEPWICHSAAE